jgi:hypothetical protein
MLIEFEMDHVFYPGSDVVMDLQTAREMVDFLVRVNLVYLTRARALGHRIPRLYESGVRYETVERWAPIPTLYRLRFGDCKNLAAALIAERRFYDQVDAQPAFRWVENADHTIDYHILEQEGTAFKDPSLDLGMNADLVARFYAA